MARFTGVLGMLVILAGAYLFSTSRKSIQWKTVLWGLGLQLTLGLLRPSLCVRPRPKSSAFSAPEPTSFSASPTQAPLLFSAISACRKNSLASVFLSPSRCFPRSSSSPLLRRALSHRRHAAHHPRRRVVDDPRHGCQRRRIPQRRRQHLHGPDRSPAHHPPVFFPSSPSPN